LIEQVECLADIKVPLINVACVIDEVGPPILAMHLLSTLDSLPDRLGRFGCRLNAESDPSAQLNALLQCLEPNNARDVCGSLMPSAVKPTIVSREEFEQNHCL
jgi:hypothetical protein